MVKIVFYNTNQLGYSGFFRLIHPVVNRTIDSKSLITKILIDRIVNNYYLAFLLSKRYKRINFFIIILDKNL